MTRSDIAGIALVAGLVGGMVARYLVPAPVFAQTQPSAPKEVRAESFVLTDESGKTIGVFTTKFARFGEQRAIILLDQNGKQIWSAGDSPLRQLTQQ